MNTGATVEITSDTALMILSMIVIALTGFNFKREREIATLAAMLKAAHKRLDRLERKENGVKK